MFLKFWFKQNKHLQKMQQKILQNLIVFCVNRGKRRVKGEKSIREGNKNDNDND